MKRTKKISSKIFLAIILPNMIIVAAYSFSNYFTTLARLETMLGEKVLAIANSASTYIDGDKHQYIIENIANAKDLPELKEMRKKLINLKKANNLKTDIYTLMIPYWIESGDKMMFVAESNEKPFELKGQDLEPHIKNSIEHGVSGRTDIFKTVNGEWISAYAPILTSEGKVSGVVEVALETGVEVWEAKKYLLQKIFFLSLFALILAIFIAIFFTRLLTRPIVSLSEATKLMIEGNLDVEIEVTSNDELGFLAESFNVMAVRLKDTLTKLRMYSDRLELVVEEKTNLARSEEQAKKEALNASDMKSRFLANMSHEIRTPLNAIIGNLSLLQLTEVSTHQSDYMSRMEVASDGLLALINDILDYSKIEANEMTFESMPFSFMECVESSCSVLNEVASQKGIELISFVSNSIPEEVLGDPTRIKQILINLLSNAVKFTKVGGVSISAVLFEDHSDHIFVKIEVKDSGIGISEKAQKKLFKPFVQADDSTTREFGGTGLGLSICFRLTEYMGGKSWVESVVGEGSSFFITLKLKKHDKELGILENKILLDKNITVYDSSPASIEMYKNLLVENGAVVTINENLSEKIDRQDVVLVDLNTVNEDPNWREMLVDFVEKWESSGVKFVLISKNYKGYRGLFDDCLEMGFSYFLTKPFNQEKIIQLIYELSTGKFEFESFNKRFSLPFKRRKEDEKSKKYLDILVIDDRSINLLIAEKFITKLGCNSTGASSGAEGLKLAYDVEKPFDIILVDYQMDGMSGIETVQKLRDLDRYKKTKMIAVSGDDSEKTVQGFKDAGIDGFILKPLSIKKLTKLLASS